MAKSTVLVVEDDLVLGEALCDTLKLAGYDVASASDGNDAMGLLHKQIIDLVVSDVQMQQMDGHALLRQIRTNYPDTPVMLMTAYGSIQKAVQAMREGAVDYLVKPFEAEVLVNMVGQYIGEPKDQETALIAESTAMRELVNTARRVAENDVTVLITGESGTGKEVLARFIHRYSKRAGQPFIAINCAAIPENMLEATLFGYAKGAFTGAYKSSLGKFEQAQGGTLLLDEISEMDLGLQAKILRVLQEREVEPLGGARVIALDVRILTTSNRALRDEVSAGRFREDLFYRLNVFPLHMSPLREHTQDIVPLAQHLLERFARVAGRIIPRLPESARKRLLEHAWPGNVRELENVLQRALVLQTGDEIAAQDIIFESVPILTPKPAPDSHDVAFSETESLNSDLKKREWGVISDTLKTENGSRKATAERLGISQRTLRYKLARMREAGIPIPGEASAKTA